MFKDIGNKLCAVAKFCAVIGTIISLIGAFCVFWSIIDDFILAGIPLLVIGIVTIISAWALYAFGQVTNDIHAIKEAVCNKNNIS